MFYVEIAGDDRITKKRGYRGLSLWAPLVSRILGRHGPTRHPHGSFLSSLYKRREKEDDHATTARLHRERNPKRQWRPTATPSSPRRRRRPRRRGAARGRRVPRRPPLRRRGRAPPPRHGARRRPPPPPGLPLHPRPHHARQGDCIPFFSSTHLPLPLPLPALASNSISLSLSLTRRLVRVSAAWN